MPNMTLVADEQKDGYATTLYRVRVIVGSRGGPPYVVFWSDDWYLKERQKEIQDVRKVDCTP